MPATAKTSYLAEQSILRFCRRHSTCFYWTFTFAENVVEKAEAMRRFRPLVDLIRRKGGEYLAFWERQSRGAWHVHLLTDVYLEVVWLRDWLQERGWGPQMRVERVERGVRFESGRGWVADDRAVARLVSYLRKYLTKSLREENRFKKAFGGSATARAGSSQFKWSPFEKAGAFLYWHGAQLYREIYGRGPTWLAVGLCIRMGYEVTGWSSFDPWMFDGFV